MRTKICPRCNLKKDYYKDFSPRSKSKPKGLRVYACKECAAKKSNEWYKKNKQLAKTWREKNWRRQHLEYTYGITLQDYERMFKKQKGVCAICQKKCSSGKRLAVDHCHTTKQVRGLLCEKCNHGLGRFQDDIKLLKSAIKYLKGVV